MTKALFRILSCALVGMALLGAIPDASQAQDSDLEQYAASEAPPAFANQQEAVDALKAALAANDFDATAKLLNEQMAAVTAYPRLTDHDDEGWHLHYRDDRQALPGVLGSVIPVGTALHLTTRGVTRLGRCAAEPCANVVADVTRNGRQRYCSVRCANRAAVRRHRARG